MSIFKDMKRTINLLLNHDSDLSLTNISYRCAPAPEEMGPSCREIQMYNINTGETINTPNKVYIQVWTPQAVEKLREAYRKLEGSYSKK